jgi:hypothetical protein
VRDVLPERGDVVDDQRMGDAGTGAHDCLTS